MKRAALFLTVLVLATSVRAESLQNLFQKTKEQIKASDWQGALKTLDALDAESARPGNENFRKQLEGPVAFYRGVCEASLDQADQARASFQAFLAVQPNASIDPAVYSKKAVAAFEQARKTSGAAAPESASGGSPSLFKAYQEFKPPANISEPASATWASGPVQWIMTDEEKRTWSALSSDGDRVEFVQKFWETRNPKPGDADNAYKTGFERRAAFADAYFVQDEKKRGSLTDRGMVFVLLGPPTWGGRKPIRTGEDTSEAAGMSTVSPLDLANAQASAAHSSPSGKVSSGQAAAIADRYSGPGTQAAESNNNYQEVWHYRRELLPKGVGYQQVDVVFITKKGYGVNVLQRETPTLATLEAARGKRVAPAEGGS